MNFAGIQVLKVLFLQAFGTMLQNVKQWEILSPGGGRNYIEERFVNKSNFVVFDLTRSCFAAKLNILANYAEFNSSVTLRLRLAT